MIIHDRFELKKSNSGGFTFIEILTVVTIVSLLAIGGFVSYRSILRTSRDSVRRADIEQIRSSIEMYRNNNSASSYPMPTISCSSSGGISGDGNTYLSVIPKDSQCPDKSYYYNPTDTSGGVCDGTALDPCLDYTLGAALENETTSCADNSCGTGQNCTYCVGPFGQK